MGKSKTQFDPSGMTLLETVMSLALVSVLLVTVVPSFRLLLKSWDQREASAETTQNAGILFDHLQSRLSTAKQITAISDASDPRGYIEFTDADAVSWRYDVGGDNCVYFGPAGDLSLLAGPVSRFCLSGYTAEDLQNPAADPAAVRLVRIDSELISPLSSGKTCPVSSAVFLRRSPAADSSLTVLLVVGNPESLTGDEQLLRNHFESWGYEVLLIDKDDSQISYDAAVLLADAAYIPSSCDCGSMGSKLTMAPLGIVSEHMDCHDDLSYSNQAGTNFWSMGIVISDNTHPITSAYSANEYVFVLSALFGDLLRVRGSEASGLHRLARRLLQSQTMMGVIERNELLRSGQPSPGRRVLLPWGSDSFDHDWLNSEGWAITRRAIEWAAGEI